MHFLEKCVTNKIKDDKILVGMSILSSKLDEVMPVNINQSCATFMYFCISLYFINLPHNYAFFLKIHQNQN